MTKQPSDQGPLLRRKSSTPHYQTFGGISPPKSRGQPLSSDSQNSSSNDLSSAHHEEEHHNTPLPKRQMAILAIIALCEQTALNSISPYLPEMASTFPEVNPSQVGVYVGTIASSFALSQMVTGLFWGWMSDRIGRKPVILCGTILTAACFVSFGFCRTLWQAILVQALMGIVNGNQGVVSTCLGEITDRSNQSAAFTYLPVIYGLGGITGPVVGGLLVLKQNPFNPKEANPYPYLLPNLFSAAVLVLDFIITTIFLEESLEEAQSLPPLGNRVRSLFSWMWQFTGAAHRPTYTVQGRRKSRRSRDDSDDDESDDESDGVMPQMVPHASEELKKADVLNRDTILLLVTYLIFQLSNISFNSLYPIFAQAAPPTGRNLDPEEIGLSLAFAGVVTILFQVGIFGKLRDKMGNRWAYRAGLGLFVIAYFLMPFVGYKNVDDNPEATLGSGPAWLWTEIGVVLLIKTVAAVGGLTSALLLITNSAPNHQVLGALNGLAQTLSAAGRAAGPFLSGGLFTVSTKVRPKGEALAFGVFGGISLIGFFLSFGIRSPGLEAEGWDSDSDSVSDKSDEEE